MALHHGLDNLLDDDSEKVDHSGVRSESEDEDDLDGECAWFIEGGRLDDDEPGDTS